MSKNSNDNMHAHTSRNRNHAVRQRRRLEDEVGESSEATATTTDAAADAAAAAAAAAAATTSATTAITTSSTTTRTTFYSTTCAGPQNLRLLVNGRTSDMMRYHATNYQQDYPHINIEIVDVDTDDADVKNSNNSGTTNGNDNDSDAQSFKDRLLQSQDWDASLFPSEWMGLLIASNRLWDLTTFLQSSETVQWTELLPFIRGAVAVYHEEVEEDDEEEDEEQFDYDYHHDQKGDEDIDNDKSASASASAEDTRAASPNGSSSTGQVDVGVKGIPRVIPLDADVLSLYYRKDLFDEYNQTVPRTWEEYTATAAFFDALALDSPVEGSAVFGSCISRIENCHNDLWTSLILASLTQTLGTSSGYFLDPDTMNPLFGAAMEEALKITREQMLYGHPDELVGECLQANQAFNDGKCAMTYNWGSQLISTIDPRIEVGVAPTPGSTRIFDRHSGSLIDCTEENCPHGQYYADIGIVNQVPFVAASSWVSGVANHIPIDKKYAVADFLAYVSNQRQSLSDILSNDLPTTVVQPYRYSHLAVKDWVDSGMNLKLASQYTESVYQINNANSAVDLRIPSADQMKEIIDEEIFDYLMASRIIPEDELSLRSRTAMRMQARIKDVIQTGDRGNGSKATFSESYRLSIGHAHVSEEDLNNYINKSFRDAAWGLSGLMCVTAVSLMIWTFRHRNNRVMRAFQPFLLFQCCVGLLLMSSSIIPLGFDDSLYDVDTLNTTCMMAPWLYVVGFTLFFCSVYAKIKECIKIYDDPDGKNILLVRPKSCMKLCARLLTFNIVVLSLWTGIDPLTWEREEVENGIMLADGTVETYGECRGGNASIGFAATLYAMNLIELLLATVQAFKCRYLVLEYNEMQWLPLSVIPFFEVWVIGGPILVFIDESFTVTFVVLSMMIVVSTGVGGMAVFAPKDWYIRKFYHSNLKESRGFPERKTPAGIMVLEHPSVESEKQIEALSYKVEQVESWNTELEIEIRMMKEKFKELSVSAKMQLKESLINEAIMDHSSRVAEDRSIPISPARARKASSDDLKAMERFQQVWKMPDEDEDDEHNLSSTVPIAKRSSFASIRSENSDLPEYDAARAILANRAKEDEADEASADDYASEDLSESTTSSLPEDPLERLKREEIEQEDDSVKSNNRIESQRNVDIDTELQESITVGSLEQTDAKMSDEEIIAQFIAERLAAADSTEINDESMRSQPEDPLETLMALYSQESSNKQLNDVREKTGKNQDELNKELVARIVALRLAAADRKGETEAETDTEEIEPEDPLERIMNMNAEDRLISAVNLQFYAEPLDEKEDDEEDAIVHKRDIHDLSSMIQEDELDELEYRAATLAGTVKDKLFTSDLADLSDEVDVPDHNSDLGMGYLALATEGKKDAVNTSGMTGLDLSKITDDGDHRFVSMSDSILDSPGRGSKHNDLSFDDSKHSRHKHPPAGQSSGTDPKIKKGLSSAAAIALEQGIDNATQFAGEPSQGESGRFTFSPSSSSKAKAINKSIPKKPAFQVNNEAPTSQNKSYSISDWNAVGGVANVLADWSDSQSATSYTESGYSYTESSAQDSVTSFEATTRASALATPLASEIDQLVGTMDWDGVRATVAKQEGYYTSRAPISRNYDTPSKNALESLKEKRQRKRELEAEADAWKESISKSFTK